MHSIHYIALDPGKTTGVYVCKREHDSVYHTTLASYEIVWQHRFAQLYDLLERYAHLNPVIVCENFVLFDRGKVNRSADMPSSQVIGSLQMALHALALDPFAVHFYPPNVKSDRAMLCSDLRQIQPSSAHCLDAYKLLVYHRVKHESYTPDLKLCYNGSINRSVTRKVKAQL